jgi:hypothetical protein
MQGRHRPVAARRRRFPKKFPRHQAERIIYWFIYWPALYKLAG